MVGMDNVGMDYRNFFRTTFESWADESCVGHWGQPMTTYYKYILYIIFIFYSNCDNWMYCRRFLYVQLLYNNFSTM